MRESLVPTEEYEVERDRRPAQLPQKRRDLAAVVGVLHDRGSAAPAEFASPLT